MLVQVQGDLRTVIRKVMPGAVATVLNQRTKYTNSEGEFGDADIMALTNDDNELAVPTYQWWEENGEQSLLFMRASNISFCKCTGVAFSCLIALNVHAWQALQGGRDEATSI